MSIHRTPYIGNNRCRFRLFTDPRFEGVFAIEKSLSAMRALREDARKARKAVILGGGFIGAEFADELARTSECEIHIIEMMSKVLNQAFDDEFCDEVAGELELVNAAHQALAKLRSATGL